SFQHQALACYPSSSCSLSLLSYLSPPLTQFSSLLPVRGRTLVFATNKTGSRKELLRMIPKEYRKRWGIETSYSKIKETKAMTKSTSNTVRMFYFMTAVLVYNA
ncbi:MAG: hypothetical protein QXW73_09005, partial [Nitrososphaerales archaeon]